MLSQAGVWTHRPRCASAAASMGLLLCAVVLMAALLTDMHQNARVFNYLRLVPQHGLCLQSVHPKPADDYRGCAGPEVVVCLEDVQVAAGA